MRNIILFFVGCNTISYPNLQVADALVEEVFCSGVGQAVVFGVDFSETFCYVVAMMVAAVDDGCVLLTKYKTK